MGETKAGSPPGIPKPKKAGIRRISGPGRKKSDPRSAHAYSLITHRDGNAKLQRVAANRPESYTAFAEQSMELNGSPPFSSPFADEGTNFAREQVAAMRDPASHHLLPFPPPYQPVAKPEPAEPSPPPIDPARCSSTELDSWLIAVVLSIPPPTASTSSTKSGATTSQKARRYFLAREAQLNCAFEVLQRAIGLLQQHMRDLHYNSEVLSAYYEAIEEDVEIGTSKTHKDSRFHYYMREEKRVAPQQQYNLSKEDLRERLDKLYFVTSKLESAEGLDSFDNTRLSSYESTLTGKQILKKRMLLFGSMGTTGLLGTGGSRSEDDDGRHGVKFALPPGHHKSANSYDSARRTPSGDTSSDSDDQDDGFEGSAERHAARAQRQRLLRALSKQTKKLESQLHLPCAPSEIASRMRNELILSFSARVLALKDSKRGEGGEAHVEPFVEWYVNEIMDPFAMSHLLRMVPMGYVVTTTCRVVYACDSRNSLSSSNALPDLAHVVLQAIKEGREEALMQFCMSPSVSFLSALNSPLNTMLIIYAALFLGHLDVVRRLVRQGFFHSQALMTLIFLHANWDDTDYVFYQRRDLQIVWNETLKANQRRHERGNRRSSMPADSSTVGPPSRPNTMVGADEFPLDLGGSTSYGAAEGGTSKALSAISEVVSSWHLEDDQLPSESIANADAIGKLSDMGQSGQSVVYGSVQRLRLLLELRKHYVHRHEENLVNQYEALRESAMKHSTRSSTVFASADVPVTQVLAKEFLNRKRSNKSLLEGDEMEDDDFEDGLGTDTLSHLLGSGRLDSLTAYPLCCTMVPAFSSPVLCRCTPWSYAPIQPTQSPLLLRVDAPINIRTAKQIIRHAYPIDVELEEKEREEQEEKAHRRKGLYSQNAEEPRTRRISTDPAHVVERSFYFEAHLALDFLLGGPELHPSVSTTPAAASAASYEHGFASTTSPTISTHDTGLSKSPSGDVIHPTAENQIVIGCCTEAVAMEANGCAGGHTKTFSALGRDEESFGISFKVLRRRMLPTFDENGEVRDEEEVVLQVMRHQHGNVSELAFPDPSRSRTTITSMLDAHRGTSTSTSRPAAEAAAHGDLLQTRDYRRSGKPMLLRMISHVDGTSNTHSHSASSEFTLDFTFGGASSAGHNEMGVSGAGAGEVDPSTVAPEGKLLSFPQVTLLDRDELEELDRAEERREMESGANNNGFETSSVNRDQAEPSATPRGTKVSDRLENSRMQPFFGGTDADDRMGTHFLSDVEVDVTEELIPCTNSLSLLGSLGLVIGFLYDPAKNTITVLVNGVSLGVVFAGVGVLAPACKSLYPAATLQANRELVSRLRAVSEGVKVAVINFGFDPNNLFAVHTLLPALTVKAPKENPPQALETSVSPAERPTSGRTVAFEPQLATKSARGPSAEQPVKDPGQDEDGDDEEEEVEVLPRILDADHKFMHLVDALTTIEEYDDQSTSGKGKSSQSSSRNSGAADELLANNAQLDDSKGFLEPMAHKVTVFRVQQMLNQASRGGFYDMLSYAPVYVRRYSRDPLDTARVNGVPIIPFRARLTPLCAAIAARQRTMAYVIATHPLTCFHNFSNQTVEERKSALLAASVLGYHEVVQVLLERMALHEILELFCLRLERESMQTMQRDFQRRAISVMRQYIYNSSSQGATAAAAHAARAEDPPATNYLINQACRTALSLNGLYCTRHASYTPLHCALLGGDHTLCVTALLNFLFSILTHARITKRTPAPPEQDKPAGFHSTRSEPNVYEDADQMEAEKKEQAELSSSLIAEAININTRVGESALFIAIRYSNREVCERLLRLGANPACKSSVSHAYGLEIACTNGHVPITKALLATDAYANSAVALNHAGVATPLCWCALNNMSEVITMLLAKGADPKISLDGNAPLLLAVTFRSQEAALALLDGCITVGESKREAAAHGGDASPSFSKPVIDVDAIDSRSQCTSLHIACELGQTAVVKALIRRDASFNVYSKAHFYTPLHTAILNGRDEVAMILLEHAKDKLRRGHCVLDVSSIDNNGNTALHLAAKKGMTHVVEYMLLQFSEEEIQRLTTIRAFTKSPTPIPYLRTNNQGKTALLLAIQAKKVDTAELIISLTTDNATNPGGPVVEGTCMAVLHAASGRLDRVVLMMLAHPLFEASEAFREQFMESYNARRDEIDRKEEANVSGPLKGEKSEGDASRHRQLSLSNKKLYPLPPSEARKYRASVAEERRFINTNYTSHLMMRTRRHTVQTWKRHLHHKKKSGTWQSTLKSQESSLPVTLTKRGTSTLGSDSQDNRRRRSSYVRMLLARVEESLPPDRTLQLLLRGFCLPELYIMLEEVSRESAVVGIQNPAAMMYGESIIGFLQEHFKMTVGPTRVVIFCKEVLHYLTGALHHAVEVGELDALPKWFDRCEEMRKALTRYPPFCQDVIRVVRLYGRTDDSKKAIDEIKALAEAFRARETAPSHMHVLRRGELVVGEETEASAKKLSFAFTEEHFRTPFNYTVMQLVASLGLPVMVHFLSEFFHLSPLHCPSQEQRQTTLTVCSGGDGADDGSAPPSSATRRRKQFLLLCEVEPCDPIPDVAGLTDRKWWFSPYRLAVLGRSPPTVDAFAFIFADMLRRRESLRGSQRFTSESWSNNNSGSIGVPPPPPVDLPISIAFLMDYKEPHWVDPHQRTALQEVLATQFLRASDDGQTEAEMELYRQRVNRQEFEVTQTMHGSSRRTINREHIRRNAMNMAMLLLEHGAAASGKFDAYGKDAWLTAVTMDSKPGSIACSILFRSGATLLGCWGDRVMGTAGNVGSEETASVAREMIHDKERLLQCWRGMGYGINLPEPERVRLLNSGRDVGDDFDYGLPRVDNGPEFSFRAPGEAAGRCADEDSYSFRDDVVLSPDKFSMLRREETHNSPTSNTNGQTPAPFEATGDESAMGVASISTRPATAVGRPTTDLTQDEMNATSAPSPSHACMQHRYRVFILFACAEHVPHHLIRLLDSFPTLLQVSALHPFTGDSLLTRVLRKAQTRLLYMDNIPSDDEVNSMATRLTTCARNRALEMSGVDQEFDAAALRSGSARPGARRASPLTVDPVGSPRDAAIESVNVTMPAKVPRDPSDIPAVWNLLEVTQKLLKRREAAAVLYHMAEDSSTPLSIAARIGYVPLISQIVCPVEGSCATAIPSPGASQQLQASVGSLASVGILSGEGLATHRTAAYGEGNPSDSPRGMSNLSLAISQVRTNAPLTANLMSPTVRIMLACGVYYGEEDAQTVYTILSCIVDDDERVEFLRWVYPNLHPLPAIRLAADYAASASVFLTPAECSNAFWVNILFAQYVGELNNISISSQTWNLLLRVLLPGAPSVPIYLIKKHALAGSSTTVSTRRTTSNAAESQTASSNTSPSRRSRQKGPGFRNWTFLSRRTDIFLQLVAITAADSLMPGRTAPSAAKSKTSGNAAASVTAPPKKRKKTGSVFPGLDDLASKGAADTLLGDVIELCVRFDNVPLLLDLVQLRLPEQLNAGAAANPPPTGGRSGKSSRISVASKSLSTIFSHCSSLSHLSSAYQATQTLQRLQAALWKDLFEAQRIDLLAVAAGSIQVLRKLYDLPESSPYLSPLRYDRVDAMTGLPEGVSFPKSLTQSSMDHAEVSSTIPGGAGASSTALGSKYACSEFSVVSRVTEHRGRILHQANQASADAEDDNTLQEDDIDFARSVVVKGATLANAQERQEVTAVFWGVGLTSKPVDFAAPPVTKVRFIETEEEKATAAASAAAAAAAAQAADLAGTPPPSGPVLRGVKRVKTPGQSEGGGGKSKTSPAKPSRSTSQSSKASRLLSLVPVVTEPPPPPPKWFMYLQGDWAMHAALVLQSPRPSANAIEVLLFLMDRRAPLSVSTLQMLFAASYPLNHWYTSYGDLLTISYQTRAHEDTLLHLLVINNQCQLAEYYLAFCLYYFSNLHYDEPNLNPGRFGIRELPASSDNEVMAELEEDGEDEFGNRLPDQPLSFLRLMLKRNVHGLSAFDYAQSAGMVQLLQQYGCVPPSYRPNPKTFCRALGLRALLGGGSRVAIKSLTHKARRELNAAAAEEAALYFQVPRIILASENFASLQDGDNAERINRAVGIRGNDLAKKRYEKAKLALFHLATQGGKGGSAAGSEGGSSRGGRRGERPSSGHPAVTDAVLLRHLLATQKHTGSSVLPILLNEDVSLLHIGLCSWDDELVQQYSQSQRGTTGTSIDELRLMSTDSTGLRSPTLDGAAMNAAGDLLSNEAERSPAFSTYALGLLPPSLHPPVPNTCTSPTHANAPGGAANVRGAGAGRRESLPPIAGKNSPETPTPGKPTKVPERLSQRDVVQLLEKRQFTVFPLSLPPPPPVPVQTVPERKGSGGGKTKKAAKSATEGSGSSRAGAKGGAKATNVATLSEATFLQQAMTAHHADVEEVVEESAAENEAALMVSMTPMQLAQSSGAVKSGPTVAAVMAAANPFMTLPINSQIRRICDLSFLPATSRMLIQQTLGIVPGHAKEAVPKGLPPKTVTVPVSLHSSFAPCDKESPANVAQQLEEWVSQHRVKQLKAERKKKAEADGTVDRPQSRRKKSSVVGTLPGIKGATSITAEPQPEVANPDAVPESYLDKVMPVGGVATAEQQTLMRALVRQFATSAGAKLSKDLGLTVVPNYDVEATGDAMAAVRVAKNTNAKYSAVL